MLLDRLATKQFLLHLHNNIYLVHVQLLNQKWYVQNVLHGTTSKEVVSGIFNKRLGKHVYRNYGMQYLANRTGTFLTKLPYIIQSSIATYSPPEANKKRM